MLPKNTNETVTKTVTETLDCELLVAYPTCYYFGFACFDLCFLEDIRLWYFKQRNHFNVHHFCVVQSTSTVQRVLSESSLNLAQLRWPI